MIVIPRLQLFEFNDAPWAPEVLKEVIIESLGIALERGGLLDGLVEPVAAFLSQAKTDALLDLGSGSGILAIGAARAGAAGVLAADIDADSVRLAAENMRANGLAVRVRVVHSAGFAKLGATRGRFDLALANILARPLTLLATPLARALKPGGTLVLSGLLADQEAWVKAAYLARRLAFRGRIAIAGWHTLVFRKPA